MGRYRNKYRIDSIRAQWWDYSWSAAYFITICTKDRKHYFGEIKKGKLNFTPAGAIAATLWHDIPNRNPNIELGEYIIMPNHMHGILLLNNSKSDSNPNLQPGPAQAGNAPSRPDSNPQSNPIPQSPGQSRFRNQGKNTISSIIGSYKSAVTKHANRLALPNGWQTRFYDIIIRDDRAFQNILNYIKNNPAAWEKDKFHSKK